QLTSAGTGKAAGLNQLAVVFRSHTPGPPSVTPPDKPGSQVKFAASAGCTPMPLANRNCKPIPHSSSDIFEARLVMIFSMRSKRLAACARVHRAPTAPQPLGLE